MYEMMDKLSKHKAAIECRLAKRHLAEGAMMLYDVTSSCAEDMHNEWGTYDTIKARSGERNRL